MSQPTPATLYYDGDCGFCRACASFVERRDDKKLIRAVPIQQSEHARSDGCYESVVFIKGGTQHQYSSAIVAILTTLGGVWWFLGTLLWCIPKPLRDWGYRLVGKHRHLLIGKSS